MGAFDLTIFVKDRTKPEAQRMAAKTAAFGKNLLVGTSNLVKAMAPKVRTGLKYAKTEIMPPSPGEFAAYRAANPSSMQAMQSWTVKEAIMKALVVVDVYFCFRIGEVLGRRSFVGYGGMDGAENWGGH